MRARRPAAAPNWGQGRVGARVFPRERAKLRPSTKKAGGLPKKRPRSRRIAVDGAGRGAARRLWCAHADRDARRVFIGRGADDACAEERDPADIAWCARVSGGVERGCILLVLGETATRRSAAENRQMASGQYEDEIENEKELELRVITQDGRAPAASVLRRIYIFVIGRRPSFCTAAGRAGQGSKCARFGLVQKLD